MNFNDMAIGTQAGQTWYRTGWNNNKQYVWYVPPGEYPARMEAIKGVFPNDLVPYAGYFALRNAQNKVVPWVPSMGDLMATDWEQTYIVRVEPEKETGGVVLEQYQSHKVVSAAKITAVLPCAEQWLLTLGDLGELSVSLGYVAKHQPAVGGYYVQYEDGYESFSPADAFELGYEKVKGCEPEEAPEQPSTLETAYARSHKLQHATDVLTQLVGSHANCTEPGIRNQLQQLIDKQIKVVSALQEVPPGKA